MIVKSQHLFVEQIDCEMETRDGLTYDRIPFHVDDRHAIQRTLETARKFDGILVELVKSQHVLTREPEMLPSHAPEDSSAMKISEITGVGMSEQRGWLNGAQSLHPLHDSGDARWDLSGR